MILNIHEKNSSSRMHDSSCLGWKSPCYIQAACQEVLDIEREMEAPCSTLGVRGTNYMNIRAEQKPPCPQTITQVESDPEGSGISGQHGIQAVSKSNNKPTENI